MRCQVSYSRKVATKDYENMSVGYQIEYECKDLSLSDEMFNKAVKFVEDKISQQLFALGVTA